MNVVLTCLVVAVSLSMDAFSLALIYGTYGMSKKYEILLAVIVGVFHFFMPLLGLGFGSLILKFLNFDLELVVGVIFLIIGVSMIVSSFKDEEVKVLMGIIGDLLFGLSVSIDSFTTGIGLSVISNNYIMVSSIFMLVSGSLTYIGLILGNKLNNSLGKYATISGGILLCLLGVLRLF